MRDHLHLLLNGRPVEVRGDDAFLTLVDFLRRRQRLTGTKVVCAEGDCGSCSALVGRRDGDAADEVRRGHLLHPVPVPTRRRPRRHRRRPAGRTGAEPDPAGDGRLPGHAVRLLHAGVRRGAVRPDARRTAGATRATVPRGLVGNLCRCTGYDSIIKAGARQRTDCARSRIDALYPPGPIVAALSARRAEEVRIETPTATEFYKPTTLRRRADSAPRIPAASSSPARRTSASSQQAHPRDRRALSTGGLPKLRGASSVEDARDARRRGRVARRTGKRRQTHLPELGRFLAWFGSPLIKNAGTIGGNLVTGSPIGDTMPALIVAGRRDRHRRRRAARRRVPIGDFYTGYRRPCSRPTNWSPASASRCPTPARSSSSTRSPAART